MNTEVKQALEVGFADLQRAKETYGPKYEDCLSQSEYRTAAWRIVELNMPLLYWTIQPLGRLQDHDDLVTELALTMFKACYNWEPSGGTFSTYAVTCMRFAYINLASELRQLERPIRLPAHVQTKSARTRKAQELAEKAATLKNTYDTAKANEELPEWRRAQHRFERSFDILERAKWLSEARTVRTHRFWDEDEVIYGEAEAVALIADKDALSVEDEAMQGQPLRDALEKGIDTLNERERFVIRMRYGLSDPNRESHTLEEIGQELGVSRERVRQIEARALRRLRNPNNANFYRDFADQSLFIR